MINKDFNAVVREITELFSAENIDRGNITRVEQRTNGDRSLIHIQWGENSRFIDVPATLVPEAIAVIEGRTADFSMRPANRGDTKVRHEPSFIAQL